MGTDDYEAVVALVEEAEDTIGQVPELVATNKLRTALAWLKRSRKHLRTALDIIESNLKDPS